MKKWLKRNGRWIMVILGVLFIANSLYGIFTTNEEWKIVWNVAMVFFWIILVLYWSGLAYKLYKWWEKD